MLLSFGTRPEAVKMAPVVQECKKLGNEVETWVMSSGQHGEMIDDVMVRAQVFYRRICLFTVSFFVACVESSVAINMDSG